ncbi:unnamed protein product [Cyclocybe aegerita]|uniref:histone acetyltransferase n=1 Tax=Cyclocybe aegerita TaxID=1973307 RepID=A0A8S0W2L1_CYCAE|nr:unnamed protein product [Cyclocybe aegerita]
MPATHVVPITAEKVYLVTKNGVEKSAHVLQRRDGEVYVHYLDTDKRLDEWVKEWQCRLDESQPQALSEPTSRKRKRGSHSSEPSSSRRVSATPDGGIDEEDGTTQLAEVVMTEEDFDLQHHKQINSQKNFDTIIFETWKITPWYFSPYPLTESEVDEVVPVPSNQPSQKIPGVARATARSHGRTLDLLAGGLTRQNAVNPTLWVCHFCFKYMVDGIPWELHKKDCKMKHPPGRKVYQRGAHTIWEVDGVKEKLYCQNLSLFGKLFIDVKTLFFDCDNFLFYILTDAKSSEDHILGFFSKEKLSYDDYNLACIMTLPQYQRKGYGMLLIEFSYELSRRAGKVGSPERPLSDLGLRSYLAYWVSTIIRFLRRVLSVLPPDVVSSKNENTFPHMRDDIPGYISGQVERVHVKQKKKSKGFDGEVSGTNSEAALCMTPLQSIQDPVFTTKRVFETTPNEHGGADTNIKVECTLQDIAKATNLRIDDAAFAMHECGLLMRRMSRTEENDTIVITRSLVEKVAKERKVKIMYLDLSLLL